MNWKEIIEWVIGTTDVYDEEEDDKMTSYEVDVDEFVDSIEDEKVKAKVIKMLHLERSQINA